LIGFPVIETFPDSLPGKLYNNWKHLSLNLSNFVSKDHGMPRKLLFFFSLISIYLPVLGQSQGRWIDFLSYREVHAIQIAGDQLMGGAQNAVFITSASPSDTIYRKLSTIQGVSGNPLLKMHYAADKDLLFVAHKKGDIELIKTQSEEVYKEQGLTLAPISEEQKEVQAIDYSDGIYYLAMPYGVTEYKTDPMGFGDTYRIGTDGTDIHVHDIKIFDGKIFTATFGNGIKYIDLDDPAKANPDHWMQIGGGNWYYLFVVGQTLYGLQGYKLFKLYPGPLEFVMNLIGTPLAVTSNGKYWSVAYYNQVLIYDDSFQLVRALNSSNGWIISPLSLNADNEYLYVGTLTQGILQYHFQTGEYHFRYPPGPLMNIPFAVDAYDDNVWIVYGDYDELYNPYPLDRRGISHLVGGHWYNIPYSAFNKVSLTDVKINRQDTSQVFIGSFHQGLLEFRNGRLVETYDPTNSTIQPIDLGGTPFASYRISPLEFDKENRLWMFQGLVMDEVHRFDYVQGDWKAYSFNQIMETAYNEGAADMHFDQDGYLWIATHRLGLVGLDPETGRLVVLNEANNIPYEGGYRNTQAAAVDKDNVLWIGTFRGLRILRNPSRAFADPGIQTEPVIIELAELQGQDNQGVELMADQEITEIVVDGSNNKWIGTANAGVFYFSEDGQQTIYHFTQENSPLPGNAIFDIAVDPVTGVVYFSTDRGLIGFKGDATEGQSSLDQAYVYPNPLNQKFHERLVIRNLMSDVSVKITDIEGNLVYETKSKGGTVDWDLRNFAGRKVATGVYLILLSDPERQHTKVLKALIVR